MPIYQGKDWVLRIDDRPKYQLDPAIEILELNRLRGEHLWPHLRRQCVREHCAEADGMAPPGAAAKEWTFLYSDGSVETVTKRVPR